MTNLISRLFGRFYTGSSDSKFEYEPEILNEQVPWTNLAQSTAKNPYVRERSSIELHKADIDFDKWPGHGAPVMENRRASRK